jgi:23S rRNA (uracil1939-C5)-methyltransferase
MAKPKYTPPVKLGDRLELDVENLASSGDGVCHHDGYTLFVPTGIKGDRVLAEVVKVTPRFGVTRVVNRIEDSPDRVPWPCPAFPQCGGCKFQGLAYEKQMEFKVQMVVDSLKRIGKLDIPETIETLPAENPYHYRNKGSFAVQEKKGKLRIGFFKEGTHEVEDSDQCGILIPPINEVKEWIRKLLLKHHISIYNENTHKGFFRGLVVRHSPSTGESLVGLLTTSNIFPKAFIRDLATSPQIEQFHISGIVQNFNPHATNIILGEVTRVIWGQSYFNDRLGDLQFRLSLNAFSQVNPVQTVRLYDLVRDWALSGEGGRVIDAYCGSGGISLWLAKSGAKVLGIEEVAEAVESARHSAQINGLADLCEFVVGDAENHMEQSGIRSVVLDPPRKGCSEGTINSLAKMSPDCIVYVSCNPSTLARDVGKLTAYKIEKLCVVDMFPQTPHVETVVLLRRR